MFLFYLATGISLTYSREYILILFVPYESPKGRGILATKLALPYGKTMPLGYPCYNVCLSHSSHTDTTMYKDAFRN
ncbi:hypothetical protein [Microseira wollei]|uniref:hypothetical protein n=1 Tax=Microseira wollei TaxID=467598 RepID=UPI001CFE5DDA|nr:hypothetical protein [Microseira wollei]